MRSRGFANPDFLILAAVLLIVGSIVVSQTKRVLRLRRQRAATAFLTEIVRFEETEHTRTGIYPVLLPAELRNDEWSLRLDADSTGWGAGVQGPKHTFITVQCGVFEGDPSHSPLPGLSTPGQVTCG